MNEVVLDVREPDEFAAERVENSIHVPLSQFATAAPGVLAQLGGRDLTLLCRSGHRARLALEEIRRLGHADRVRARVFDGGISEWKRQGRETIRRGRAHLPVMRQVHLIAGSAVVIATLLGAFVHPGFLGVAAFIGAGLVFSGATGFCGMAMLLSRMPWNASGT